MRYRNIIKADPGCRECGGSGEIVTGWESSFNVSRMEMGVREAKALCKCAEVIEPDWDAIRDARDER